MLAKFFPYAPIYSSVSPTSITLSSNNKKTIFGVVTAAPNVILMLLNFIEANSERDLKNDSIV